MGLVGRGSDTDQQKQLQDKLQLHLLADVFGAWGIPVHRLGVEASNRLAGQFVSLGRMSSEELRRESEALGMLPVQETAELLSRLRTARVWSELPMIELLRECTRLELPVTSARTDEAEQRFKLVDMLLCSLCTDTYTARGIPAKRLNSASACSRLMAQWERFTQMSPAELKVECERTGLPPTGSRQELLNRLQTLSCWREMPISELREESRHKDARLRHAELVELLVKAKWPSAHSVPPEEQKKVPTAAPPPSQVTRHFSTLQLPVTASLADIRSAYRQLARRYHPDKNLGEGQQHAAQKFREVAEAYDALDSYLMAAGS